MCLAAVYIEHDGEREKVMQDVAWIRPEDDGFEMITFLGESKQFQAKIRSIDLVKGAIVLEMAAQPPQGAADDS